jgi:hypothetical protein
MAILWCAVFRCALLEQKRTRGHEMRPCFGVSVSTISYVPGFGVYLICMCLNTYELVCKYYCW